MGDKQIVGLLYQIPFMGHGTQKDGIGTLFSFIGDSNNTDDHYGTGFLPEFNEGSLTISAVTKPEFLSMRTTK